MKIRKFIITIMSLVLIITISSILIYQNVIRNAVVRNMAVDSNLVDHFTRTNNGKIEIYVEDKWENLIIKGIQINSFTPGYSRNKSGIEKIRVMKWLKQISEMNANVITIPNIQPPSFYNAIYEFNLNNPKPIYVIHEIPLYEGAILKHYDAYNQEIIKPLKKDIKKTIDVVHGNSLLLNNSRNHTGIYLKDISKYVLGYIIGTNTNAELITLTNINYPEVSNYDGQYFISNDVSSFEVFITEVMDIAARYEVNKYNQLSLFSYLTSVDTDPLIHINELNFTKNANINLENIVPVNNNNIFSSYTFHPNAYDFMDYDEPYNNTEKDDEYNSVYYNYLKKINQHYTIPVVISNFGIPTSRGMSKINIKGGFNRGNINEDNQGEQLVELLDYIYTSGSAGAVVYNWQDDWAQSTAFNILDDYLDGSSSTYWFDAQASDESFGIMSFDTGEIQRDIYIDGNFSDWNKITPLISEKDFELKVSSDTAYIYLMIGKKGLSLTDDKLYIGLDITPKSGSKNWEDKLQFNIPVDYIIELLGYNESRILVHERYNLFNYLYKYYSNTIEKQDTIPDKDSKIFSAIYLLNRKHFYLKEDDAIIPPVYYQTGKLVYGNGNPKSDNYNSLTDFNKEGDFIEMKIPWTLLNIKNPMKKTVQDDFYINGVKEQINIKDINIELSYHGKNKNLNLKPLSYKIPSYKDVKYHSRLKKSYYYIQNYWK